MTKCRIIIAASECTPFAKTGGMADVVQALAKELAKLGCQVSLFLPYYKQIKEIKGLQINDLQQQSTIRINSFYKEASYYQTLLPDTQIPVYLIENKEYFNRDQLYTEKGEDYTDNLERFILFSKALLNFLLINNMQVDVIHCNDWQTAPLPAYIRLLYNDELIKNIKTLFTIHNISYQGIFNINDYHKLTLEWEHCTTDKFEFYGKINLLKSAIVLSDAVNTVSPTYKDELISGQVENGLEDTLANKEKNYYGILNGADYKIWNPATDTCLNKNYSLSDLSGKKECKKELLKIAGLKGEQKPLLVCISRLINIKGFDLLISTLNYLLNENINLIILGKGDPYIEHQLTQKEKQHINFKLFLKFDEELAHKIEAGGDIYLMPSFSEPCGLNQMYSLKYGTVPVAHHTGGLADTIINYSEENLKAGTATGFMIYNYAAEELKNKIMMALALYKDKVKWKKLMKTGMRQDFSWKKSAQEYLQVYDNLIGPKPQSSKIEDAVKYALEGNTKHTKK